MRIDNTLSVSAGFDEVWRLMTDLEQVAPCMPGASIAGRQEDGAYRGNFRIKVGPVSAAYDGTIAVLERDDEQGRIVLRGSGTDPTGAGSVDATITAHVKAAGEQTRVDLSTDLDVGGKLAQFSGRGSLMQGIADRVIGQFATRLGERLAAGDGAPGRATEGPAGGAEQQAPAPEAEAFDAGSLLRDLMVARLEPKLLFAAATAAVLGYLVGRGRRRGRREHLRCTCERPTG